MLWLKKVKKALCFENLRTNNYKKKRRLFKIDAFSKTIFQELMCT